MREEIFNLEQFPFRQHRPHKVGMSAANVAHLAAGGIPVQRRVVGEIQTTPRRLPLNRVEVLPTYKKPTGAVNLRLVEFMSSWQFGNYSSIIKGWSLNVNGIELAWLRVWTGDELIVGS